MAVAVTSDVERAAIVATALDYFEGWFDGDAERMERALHPVLAKRGPGLRTVTKEEMVTWTAEGEGKAKDPGPGRRIDVTVVDVHGEHRQRRRRLGRVPRVSPSRPDGRRLEDRQRAMAVDVTPAREQTRARYPDESGYVERDGVRVFYEVYGSGEPTFLLLPTWSIIHSRQWKGQIPFLARDHRVVTFDGRGNGRSDRPTASEAYDEREFALDALAVLDATATDRAVIVGYSLGAPRGLILAVEQPERVAGAVFIGAAYSGGGEPLPERVMPWEDELETDEGWAKYNRHYWLRDYRGFLEFFFGKIFREPHSTKQIEDCVGWGLETTAETLIAAHYGAKPDPEEAQELARRVRCPVLVLHGTDDAIASHTRGRALAEHTGGELVLLEGAGHAPHARDPVFFNILLRDFARRLS